MEIIKHTIDEQIIFPRALNQISDKKVCFLDIETTGFSRKFNQIILIGFLYFDNSKTEVIQIFAGNKKDEKNLLSEFVKYISNFEVIITFNGDAFDIPFINSRLSYHSINYEIDKSLSIDILKVIRNNKNLLGLEKYNLKAIENLLGINREDTISGKESIEMYYEYIKTKNNNIMDTILGHNYEDIYNLPKIIKIFDIIEDKSRLNINIEYLNCSIDIAIKFDSVKCKGNMMHVEGFTNTLELPDEMHYGDSHTFKWSPQIGELQISFQIENGKLSDGSKCIYINSKVLGISNDKINKMNYKLPDEILILYHNGKIVMDNFEVLIRQLWQNLNTD